MSSQKTRRRRATPASAQEKEENEEAVAAVEDFSKRKLHDSIKKDTSDGKGEGKNTDWVKKGIKEVEYQAKKFKFEKGVRPSIREIYYVLESNKLISKTKSMYTSYDHAISKAIQDDRLDITLFADDDTRPSVEHFQEWYPEDWADAYVYVLKRAAKEYKVPIWTGQPNRVFIIVEKVALMPAIKHFLNPYQVSVKPNRGWDSNKAFDKFFKEALEVQKKTNAVIVLLYIGDLDPSGYYMSDKFEQKLGIWNQLQRKRGKPELRYRFERIALKEDQVEKYSLEWIPDEAAKDKLMGISEEEAAYRQEHGEENVKAKKGDSRTAKYIEQHRGFIERHRKEVEEIVSGDDEFSKAKDKVWFPVVEIEAFTALKGKEFQELIIETVMSSPNYYSRIWDQYKDEFDKRRVNKVIRQRIKRTLIDAVKKRWIDELLPPPLTDEDTSDDEEEQEEEAP